MRCEAAERELSARLDGVADRRLDDALEDHLRTCPRCAGFAERAQGIRQTVRLEPAQPVSELTASIMRAVRAESERPRLAMRVAQAGRAPWLRPVAAFAIGVLASVVALGGLGAVRRPGLPAALAAEIPELVAEASRAVTSYRASFDIVEHNFHELVPTRRFDAEVAFEAPERFVAEVRDRTEYPSGQWPANDLLLTVDADRWSATGPQTCPRESLPDCTSRSTETRSVSGREPFDTEAVLPTEIVLPVRTLAGSDRVEVIGDEEVAGRRSVTVALPHRDATPLFAFLRSAGLWRPFFPLDRVAVSLDHQTWFPLAYEVRAGGSAERERWAAQHGLPDEPPGTLLFEARASSFDIPGPLLEQPAPAEPSRDAGFRDATDAELAAVLGTDALRPTHTAGLDPHRTGVRSAPGEVVLSYATGLAWLKVRQTRSWTQPTLFGDVGALASEVPLGDTGVGYYEPATAVLGRRLSIHAQGWDVYLETNLPPDVLIQVAASLPVHGLTVPETWSSRTWPGGIVRHQVSLEDAVAANDYVLLPRELPADYRSDVVHVVEAGGRHGVTVFFRRVGLEPDGIGLRLHQAPGAALSPPMEPEVMAVRLRGTVGRYSPERAEIEWVEAGVYRSLRGAGFDLGALLDLAASLEAP